MHVSWLSFKANTDVSAANFTFVATRMLTSHIAEKYLINSFCGFSPLHHGRVTIMTQNHREQMSKTGRLHLAAVPVWSLSRRRSAQSLAGTDTSQTDEPGDSGTQQPAILLSDIIRQCPWLTQTELPCTSTQRLFSKSRPTGIIDNEHVHSHLWWQAQMKTNSFLHLHSLMTHMHWE